MFKLKIETKGSAFYTGDAYTPSWEIQQILRSIADKIYVGNDDGVVHDTNGNRVGEWTLTKR
jgi:hypothetical protein